jgi:hypothetical protein
MLRCDENILKFCENDKRIDIVCMFETLVYNSLNKRKLNSHSRMRNNTHSCVMKIFLKLLKNNEISLQRNKRLWKHILVGL